MLIKDLLNVFGGKVMVRQNNNTIYSGYEIPVELLEMEVKRIAPTTAAGDGGFVPAMWVFI